MIYSTEDEQEPTIRQPQKASQIPKFVEDTDSDDEQEPQKASKTSDDEQEPAVKRIVMYSTEDEQGPTIKQPQKASKIPDPQETSSALVKLAKIPNFVAASCTLILKSSVR